MNATHGTPRLTPDQLAEQAGHAIGSRMLNAMFGTKSQAECLALLRDAITDAAGHPAAIAGLAVSLVCVVQTGLMHLPRGNDEGGAA